MQAAASNTPIMAQATDRGSFAGQLTGLLDLGGPVVAILLLISVFSLTVILLKFWQFLKEAKGEQEGISEGITRWAAQDYEMALQDVGKAAGPVARVVEFAMRGLAGSRKVDHVREETEAMALTHVASLRSYMRALEAVVQAAPLLGLFGTVLGMIDAFQALQAAGSQVNPADLAGGIWVALLTTAVGLAIAIPVSLVLHWFEGRIERERQVMENALTAVLAHPPSRKIRQAEPSPLGVARTHAAE